MSKTKTEVSYDLTLSVNFTLELSQDTVDAINQAIVDGDIEESSVEEYITTTLISDVEDTFDITAWLPEVDGELRAWVCTADLIKKQNAARMSA